MAIKTADEDLSAEEIETVGRESDEYKSVHGEIKNLLEKLSTRAQAQEAQYREIGEYLLDQGDAEEEEQMAGYRYTLENLLTNKKEQSTGLRALLRQPYFGRVKFRREEDGREIRFRVGKAACSEQRIVDWRTGHLSKLYYQFAEGEEFTTQVNDQAMDGEILERRSFDGGAGKLTKFETPDTLYLKGQDDQWIKRDKQVVSDDPWNYQRSRAWDAENRALPEITSLLTRKQFQLISENPKDPLIIQGTPGSGKTTVALHRLAFLLDGKNTTWDPRRCRVVVFNPVFARYIEDVLPTLGVDGVEIITFEKLLKEIAGSWLKMPVESWSPHQESFGSVEEIKSGVEVAAWYTRYWSQNIDVTAENVRKFWLDPKTLKFIEEHFSSTAATSWEQVHRTYSDPVLPALDFTLIALGLLARGRFPKLDHMVIDEAQDYNLPDFLLLQSLLENKKSLTIVGDKSQRIYTHTQFVGWREMCEALNLNSAAIIELTTNHRSTRPIMDFARRLLKDSEPADGRPGHPVEFLKVPHRKAALREVEFIIERLEKVPSIAAIIAPTEEMADEWFNVLRHHGDRVRRGTRERFTFEPGVIVTSVFNVKGLEFDHVVMVGCTEENYPPKIISRSKIYVGATRAMQNLYLIAEEEFCFAIRSIRKNS